MHNAAFSKLKIKALYIPLSVELKKLKQTIKELKTARIGGFNVTIPFKSACISSLDKIDKPSQAIGAVNTVVIKNNKLFGYNTDATGFIKSVKEDLKLNLKGKRCILLGAGGGARAVGFALAKEGAKQIFITDIEKAKATSLARNLRKYFPKCEAIYITKSKIQDLKFETDLLVNATPLGMKKTDPLPVNPKILHKKLAIYDLVYNPSPTKLVKEAKKRKAKAANGLGMLLYQGAEAFKLWTGKAAPVGVMRRTLETVIKC